MWMAKVGLSQYTDWVKSKIRQRPSAQHISNGLIAGIAASVAIIVSKYGLGSLQIFCISTIAAYAISLTWKDAKPDEPSLASITVHNASVISQAEQMAAWSEVTPKFGQRIEEANKSLSLGKLADAAKAFEGLSVEIGKTHSPLHPAYLDALQARANALFWMGNVWEARSTIVQAHSVMQDVQPTNGLVRLKVLTSAADCLLACFEHEDSTHCRRLALNMCEALSLEGSPIPIPLFEQRLILCWSYIYSDQLSEGKRIIDQIREPPGELDAMRLEILQIMLSKDPQHLKYPRLDRISQRMQEMAMNKDPLTYLVVFVNIFLTNQALGRNRAEDLERNILWAFVNLSMDGAIRRNEFGHKGYYENVAIPIALSLCISSTYTAQYQRVLTTLTAFIKLLTTTEHPYLYLFHAVRGAVLCCQYKFMEAEEHIQTALRFFEAFFGRDTLEFHHTNLFLAFVLLARGQYVRASACINESLAFFREKDSELQLQHLLLLHMKGVHAMCSGDLDHAEQLLESVLQYQYSEAPVFNQARARTMRCLGVLAAIASDWDLAHERFIASSNADAAQTAIQGIAIDHILGKWGLVWILYERGDNPQALLLLKDVLRDLEKQLGQEHRLTLSCRHDLLLLADENEMRAEALVTLCAQVTVLLGTDHHLTQKIQRSLAYVERYREENASNCPRLGLLPKRIYLIGDSTGMLSQLSEVDWLSWMWNDDLDTVPISRAESWSTHMPTSSTVPEQQPASTTRTSAWWDMPRDEESRQIVKRKMDTITIKAMSDLYAKLILDFPRDFSPAFVEHQYASEADAPFEVLRVLGSGGFSKGKVEMVRHQKTDEIFARKTLIYTRQVEQNTVVRAEINSLRKLCHEHIVKLCAGYVVPSKLIYALLMQPVADCNLAEFLEVVASQNQTANKVLLTRWLPCLTDALHYMHSKEIRHKDIKPENILVKGETVLFTDFGLARDWGTKMMSVTSGTPMGTRMYWSPEVQACRPRTRSSDVFSLGCVFAQILTVAEKHSSIVEFESWRDGTLNQFEFHWCVTEAHEMDGEADSGPFDGWFGDSVLYRQVVKAMLNYEPALRPTTGEILVLLGNGNLGTSYGSLTCFHRAAFTDKV